MFNFWQYFHDGGITQILGSIPGDLEILVEIPYLREIFPIDGTSFVVSLQNCNRVEYDLFQESQGSIVSQIAEIIAAEPQILYADFIETGVKIECDKGILRIDYESARITLDSGQPVGDEVLVSVSNRYWNSLGKEIHVN